MTWKLLSCLLIVCYAVIIVESADPDDQCLATKSKWLSKLIDYSVENCETGKTCLLQQGTNTTIKIQFVPHGDLKEVHARVTGIVHGVPVPYGVPQPYACSNSGITCPVPKGTVVNYFAQLNILKLYPALPLKVKWELVDQDKNVIVCLWIPAKIVKAIAV